MRLLAIALTALLLVVSVAGMVGGFAVLARRLLGLRFGTVRLLVAGFLGLLAAGPIAEALAGSVPRDGGAATPVWFLILGGACALIVAMVFLVVAEALVPSGSVPGPLAWRRALRGRIARARRYAQISRIAFRHGLTPFLSGRRRAELDTPDGRRELARSVRQALDEGGVTFVKLGQVLSTRPDLLPAEFVEELGQLQDHVAPAGWDQVEQVLAAELGAPVEEVFARFDREPLAAASVAQVHAARLRSGEAVVVKVQRPGIRTVVERDLDIIVRLARSLESRTRWARTLGTRSLALGFADAVREELDFRIEAGNMAGVAATAGGRVRIPVPYQPLSGERVLVMERLDGTPLSAAGPLIADRGLDRDGLARDLLECLLRQVMVTGVFHADPHPGNVLVLADGRRPERRPGIDVASTDTAASPGPPHARRASSAGALGLLDFGSVGRLDASVRAALQRLLLAMDRGDPLAASDAMLEVMLRPDEVDTERLERALGQFMARYLSPGATPGVRMFSDLFRIVSEHGLSVPPEVAAVFRALATLEGTLAQLAPGLDLVAEARAFAGRQGVEQLDPGAARRLAAEELTTLLPMLRRLPRRLERIAGAAEHGRLSLQVRLFADERDRRHVTGLLHQVLLTILAATAGIMAVLLLGTAGGPRVTATVSLYQLLGYNLLVVCAILALRVLVLIFRPDR
jgi:ubiquinone biosynthesis protein